MTNRSAKEPSVVLCNYFQKFIRCRPTISLLTEDDGFYLYKWFGPLTCTGDTASYSIQAHSFDPYLLSTDNHVTLLLNAITCLTTGVRK